MKKPRQSRSRRLQYENLERRELMAVTAGLSGGVLTVTGTKYADHFDFQQTAGLITINGMAGSWSADQVNSIVVNLKKGYDAVSFDSIANGGTQALAENIYFSKSSAGTDTVRLADGHDVSLYGKGHILSISTAGVATLDGTVLSWSTPSPDPTPDPTPDPSPDPTPDPTPPPPSTNWFDTNVMDTALRTLGHNLYTDGRIDRNDMIALLRNVEDGGTVDSTEFTDLNAIVSNSTLFGTLDYVWKLSSYIVSGNVANAKYQGQTLGNLAAGSTTAQMENLINKWFLGLDRPTAGGAYRQIAGTLFVGGADLRRHQAGHVGDCYFMASLAETALKNPSAITNMFVVNGDGTYTVKFYNNGQAAYVTVDSYLPTNGAGQLIYANLGAMYNNASNELWTALAEKAYVQINEMGWLRSGLPGSGQNAYSAIAGGYIFAALGQITGQATTPFASTAGTTSFTTFVTAFNQGKSIGFASKSTPASTTVVGGHAYAVVGYDADEPDRDAVQPLGHPVRPRHHDLEPNPGQLLLLRSDRVGGVEGRGPEGAGDA